MADGVEAVSEERCIVPRCPQCEEPMMIYFKGGDLSKPAFGHRKSAKNCGMYLGGAICSKDEAIHYPSARPKVVEKPAVAKKSSKQAKPKRKPKVDHAWAKNTLTTFGEPPGLDPNWTGD